MTSMLPLIMGMSPARLVEKCPELSCLLDGALHTSAQKGMDLHHDLAVPKEIRNTS